MGGKISRHNCKFYFCCPYLYTGIKKEGLAGLPIEILCMDASFIPNPNGSCIPFRLIEVYTFLFKISSINHRLREASVSFGK